MARILVVEDDDSFRRILRSILESAGHGVLEAADGRRGIDIYRREAVDLVITDIFMPGQDGLGIINELRRDNRDARVIVVSASARNWHVDYLKMAKMMGARHVLSKPFPEQDLLDAIDESLAGDGSAAQEAP